MDLRRACSFAVSVCTECLALRESHRVGSNHRCATLSATDHIVMKRKEEPSTYEGKPREVKEHKKGARDNQERKNH
eukprot:1439941-Amphidinium_carterae.1